MTATPATAQPLSDRAARRAAVLERQVERLDRLAEAGLEIALSIQRRVTAIEHDAYESGLIAQAGFYGYTRVARAVRLTLMLQARVLKQLEALDEAPTGPAADGPPGPPGRIVGGGPAAGGRARGPRAEEGDRLERDDITEDELDRPVDELIAEIGDELGLEAGWDEAGHTPRLGQAAGGLAIASHQASGSPPSAIGEDLVGPHTVTFLPPS